MTNNSGKYLHSETQRFRQIWIWLIVLLVAIIAWWGFIQQIILKSAFGDNPAPDALIWVIFIFFGWGLPWLLFSLRLETGVSEDHLRIRFWPLTLRTFFYRDIKTLYVRDYRPIAEYGGWGIRWSGKNGMAYNVSGKRGLQLELTNGKKILIGSQKPEELHAAIRQASGRR